MASVGYGPAFTAILTNQAARAVIEAAIAAAEVTDQRYSVAVVDAAGHLNAFARMDGAPHITIQVTTDKACTAAGFGMTTQAWHDFIKDDAPLATGVPAQIDRIVTFGGGIPITAGGHPIGGIGVCGGHWSDDIRIAEAGLAAIA
ncbi:heme-binding protein [Nonomuraea rhodomycinica]|uniref:Heme-binding protein n=1 Tax=Nonomuraea rhodomycinica TaxID=1712872 RepID=A0A7Y6IKD8_9ACTN|nr:heme-binding protein [Nonomuraea rhodomycinica]